ncbi:MAG: hypothetical protein IPL55_07540 [Saprospiraceae bacterium]|nr:hypothetical protein [Saprospiraceae bacterium]
MINTERISKNIDRETGYFFLRSMGGSWYETFIEENFVSIVYPYVYASELNERTTDYVKRKIMANEGTIADDSISMGKATKIFNRIYNFHNLVEGDVIIIPNENTNILSFGYISSNETFRPIIEPYTMAKRIIWVAHQSIYQLDAHFIKLKKNQNAIIDASFLAEFIDAVMNPVYVKDNIAHLVFDIVEENGIHLTALTNFGSRLTEMLSTINEYFEFGEEIDNIEVQVTLNSPGKLKVKLSNGRSLLLAAAILSIMSCGHADNVNLEQDQKDQIIEYMDVHENQMATMEASLDSMRVNTERFENLRN